MIYFSYCDINANVNIDKLVCGKNFLNMPTIVIALFPLHSHKPSNRNSGAIEGWSVDNNLTLNIKSQPKLLFANQDPKMPTCHCHLSKEYKEWVRWWSWVWLFRTISRLNPISTTWSVDVPRPSLLSKSWNLIFYFIISSTSIEQIYNYRKI